MNTIATKEIDNILDSMVDNRATTKAVIYIAKTTDGKTDGCIIGRGQEIENLFYSLLKQNDDCAELMLAALERATLHSLKLETTAKQ